MRQTLYQAPRPACNKPGRQAVLAVACGFVLLAAAGGVYAGARNVSGQTLQIAQQAAAPQRERSRERHRRRGHERGDVNVFIAPQTEHWPSNYVPDNYRLEGYDGQPDRPTVCRGQSGRTLSTADIPCPDGQQPATGGRSWSTTP